MAETEATRANTEAARADQARSDAEAEALRANREAERANTQAAAAEAARSDAEEEAARANREAEQANRETARATAEADRATRNFDIAKSTVDQVIFDIAQGLRSVEGMRLDTLRTVLTRVEAAMTRLADAAPDDLAVQRSRGVMLHEFGNTYLATGDGPAALVHFEESLAIQRRLGETDPGNRRTWSSVFGSCRACRRNRIAGVR